LRIISKTFLKRISCSANQVLPATSAKTDFANISKLSINIDKRHLLQGYTKEMGKQCKMSSTQNERSFVNYITVLSLPPLLVTGTKLVDVESVPEIHEFTFRHNMLLFPCGASPSLTREAAVLDLRLLIGDRSLSSHSSPFFNKTQQKNHPQVERANRVKYKRKKCATAAAFLLT